MRMKSIPLNPEWLGGAPSANSEIYEQSKINHCKIVYKPYVDELEGGAIALAFETNPDKPCLVTGQPALKQYAQGTYADTKIIFPMSLTIKPSDMNVKYDADGGSAMSVQGMLRVLSASPLAADLGLGHLYLEYDIEFFGPTLNNTVNQPVEGIAEISWTAANITQGDLLLGLCGAAAGGAFKVNLSNPPPDDGYIYTLNVKATTGANGVLVLAQNSPDAKSITGNGIEFFMRTLGYGSHDFTDSSVEALFYTTMNTAQQMVSDDNDAVSDGQMIYAISAGSVTVTVTCEYTAVPVV